MDELKKKTKTSLAWIILIAVPVSVYTLVLVNRSPSLLRPASVAVRFSFNGVILLVMLLLWGGFALKGWPGRWVSLTIVLGLFGLALAGIWASGQSDALIMTGLLPISDAEGYYLDANLMLNGQPFSVFSSRRPLFAGLLAVLLKVTGQNLQITVAILVLVTAASCYLAARAVRRSSGPLAAAIFVMILFLFYRRFAGTTMTENLGLSLGSLGFALLWRSPNDKRAWTVILGIGVLTLGLIARAGPFFILIGVIVWAALQFRENKSFSKWMAAAGALVVILGFGLNYLMYMTLGSPNGVLFTNFTYSFYGLATGGQRWDAVFQEHPEVLTLSEKEQPAAIFKLAFEKIKQNPMGPILGIIKQYGYLVSNTWYNAYGYVSNNNDSFDLAIEYFLMALALLALVLGWRQRKNPHVSLMLAMFAGILVSVPFVPPGDTNRMRAYATVIPIFALLPALGFKMLLERMRLGWLVQPPDDDPVWDLTPFVAVILLVMVSLVPMVVRWSSSPINLNQPIQCKPGQDSTHVFYSAGSYIRVHNESDFFLDWMPDFHQGRYVSYVHSMPYMELMGELLQVNAPVTLFVTNDLKTNQPLWVAANSTLLPAQHGILALCGTYRPQRNDPYGRFFDVSSAQLLRNPDQPIP